MKINLKIISFINIFFVVAVMSLPYFVLAQGGAIDQGAPSAASANNPLVKCDTVDGCTWTEFLSTLDRVKDYGLQIVVILSVLAIVYAGGLYLFSMGNSAKIQQAHSILQNVVIGFFLAAAGWLIVSALLRTLGVKDGFAPDDLLNNRGI